MVEVPKVEEQIPLTTSTYTIADFMRDAKDLRERGILKPPPLPPMRALVEVL